MDTQYKGMTVNERLYVSGFSEIFGKAVKEKDVIKVIDILKNVEITTDESAINSILVNLGLIDKV